jgi:hypothetical protein
MAKGKKRSVYHSILTKEGWTVMLDKAALSLHDTQRESEREAMALAKKDHAGGGLSQVVFHKSDGVISEERTYGKDPEKTPG